MKISGFSVFLISFFLICASCASTKSSVEKASPVSEEPEKIVEPVKTSNSSLGSETPIIEATPQTTSPDIAVLPDSVLLTDVSEKPDVAQERPGVPSAEKILYFYPEPDLVFSVPETKTAPITDALPPKIVSSQTAPAASVTNPPAVKTKPVAQPSELKKIEKKVPEISEEKKSDESAIESGIWETEIESPTLPVHPPAVTPSRKASLSVGQSLDVLYPGTGWVFLGDASSQNGLTYDKRKLEKTDTLFSFKALKQGNYILNFSRFDVLEDEFASDSLAVEVLETSTKKIDRVLAPHYKVVSDSTSTTASTTPQQEASVTVRDEPLVNSMLSTNPAIQTVALTPINNPEESLKQAKAALVANDPAKAITMLDAFFSSAISSLDEGIFLKGQAYEANSPLRDVRKALEAYETLVSAYPESLRWKEADARIRYIKQFYLMIR